MQLLEMALNRGEAIDRCCILGEKFIQHFHKLFMEGKSDPNFNHHCSEMQGWWNSVCEIRLKHNNKLLTNTNLIDWFFTVGAAVEDYLKDPDEIEAYNKFYIALLYNGFKSDVKEIVYSIM